ncbi:hypothetical protein [Streptomyces sp. NPDC054784]
MVRRGDRGADWSGTAPLGTAAVVRAANDRMMQDGTVPADEPWRALEVLAER